MRTQCGRAWVRCSYVAGLDSLGSNSRGFTVRQVPGICSAESGSIHGERSEDPTVRVSTPTSVTPQKNVSENWVSSSVPCVVVLEVVGQLAGSPRNVSKRDKHNFWCIIQNGGGRGVHKHARVHTSI